MTRTIRLTEGELYPAYFTDPGPHGTVIELDVPDEVAQRWTRVLREFGEVTDEIHAAYRAVEFGAPPDELPYPGRKLR